MDQEYLRLFLRPDTLAMMIPVVAILVGGIIAMWAEYWQIKLRCQAEMAQVQG